jgi:AbrB family looped-hinge helix DNA binding protein
VANEGRRVATRVKVSSRYQIAVPAEARKRLRINRGDDLLVDIRDGSILLVPEPRDYGRHLRGLHREVWEGVEAQQYVQQEREAWST